MSKSLAFAFVPGDWETLQYIINDMAMRITDEGTSSSPQYILANGTRSLSANWNAGSYIITSNNFISDVAIGTSPYAATSTTLNTNLNADLLDGQHGSYYASSSGYVPYSGATTTLDLGAQNFITTGIIRTLNTDRGILSTGTTNGYTIPSGAGTRFMWIPSIPAFRAGKLNVAYSTYWDAANLGISSVVMGTDCKASGESAISFGYLNQTTGDFSLTCGNSNVAQGNQCIAIGDANTTIASNSTAFGSSNDIYEFGENSVAIGYDNNISSANCVSFGDTNTIAVDSNLSFIQGLECSVSATLGFCRGYLSSVTFEGGFASGYNCLVNGTYGVAIGENCEAYQYSLAVGSSCIASGFTSIALGLNSVASASGSFCFGAGDSQIASAVSSILFGNDITNSVTQSFMIGWGVLAFRVQDHIFTFAGTANTDLTFNFSGTTNSGILYWMEDEDYFKFSDDIMMVGGENIILSATTGTKIGTATTQLLGFYNATPVDQPATIADPSGGGTQDAEARTAINTIIDRLQELGLIA